MKKVFLYLLLIVTIIPLYGQKENVSEKHIKLIFDSYKRLPETSENVSVFWDFIRRNNKQFMEYINDDSKLAKNNQKEFEEVIQKLDSYAFTTDETEIKVAESFCGNNYSRYIKGITYEDSDELNAYALPNGMIYVSNRLAEVFDHEKNTVGLIGIIAHEITHSLLWHSETHFYQTKKKKRSNNRKKIITGVLGAATLAAIPMIQANSGAILSEDYLVENNKAVTSFLQVVDVGFDLNSLRHHFSYSREQEIEADIIACLFLEWCGENPYHYIKALETLDRYTSNYRPVQKNTQYNTHPSFEFRIATLKKYWSNY